MGLGVWILEFGLAIFRMAFGLHCFQELQKRSAFSSHWGAQGVLHAVSSLWAPDICFLCSLVYYRNCCIVKVTIQEEEVCYDLGFLPFDAIGTTGSAMTTTKSTACRPGKANSPNPPFALPATNSKSTLQFLPPPLALPATLNK